jgi:hypothetical protein
MSELARFFGIVVRMHYWDRNPPHIHVEYQNDRALLDFQGNVIRGDLGSRTALGLARDWIDLHFTELEQNWAAVRAGRKLHPIEPLK